MKNYIMLVEIPIKKVPNEIPIKEVRVTSEVWLAGKIPDGKVIRFKEANLGNRNSLWR